MRLTARMLVVPLGVAFLVLPSPAYSGASEEHLHAQSAAFDADHYYKVPNKVWAHIEVQENRAETATNGSPPYSRVRIVEILWGDYEGPRDDWFRWHPFPSDVDWVGRGAAEARAEWAARQMNVRPAKSSWIVTLENRTEWGIAAAPILPASKLKEVKAGLSKYRDQRVAQETAIRRRTRVRERWANGTNGLTFDEFRKTETARTKRLSSCVDHNPCTNGKGQGKTMEFLVKVTAMGQITSCNEVQRGTGYDISNKLEGCIVNAVCGFTYPRASKGSEFFVDAYVAKKCRPSPRRSTPTWRTPKKRKK